MIIEILAIGDEILSGDILNSNAQYLSEKCWLNGLSVEYHSAVRDDETAIRQALLLAASRADAVLCTGGMGPTADDFTVEVAAQTFGRKLVRDPRVLAYLEERYASRGAELNETNRRQADLPEGGVAFVNLAGAAPGIYCPHGGKHFYFMPGVPKEMKYLFEEHLLPHLVSRSADPRQCRSVMLKTFGRRESELDAELRDLLTSRTGIGEVRLGFRVAFPEIYIKLSAWDADAAKAEAKLQEVLAEVESRVGRWIYARGSEATMEGEVVQRLKARGKKLALAESCTGGTIANRVTNVSGASEIFLGGVVSYDNAVKRGILGVPESVLERHGAVSEECAEAMVRGIQKITGADVCAAVTGIAGPTGGTPHKPAGTVWIATLIEGVLKNKLYFAPLPRDMFKQMAAGIVFNRILGVYPKTL